MLFSFSFHMSWFLSKSITMKCIILYITIVYSVFYVCWGIFLALIICDIKGQYLLTAVYINI